MSAWSYLVNQYRGIKGLLTTNYKKPVSTYRGIATKPVANPLSKDRYSLDPYLKQKKGRK